MQMLNKAHEQFSQTHKPAPQIEQPTSHSTPGGNNNITEPKPISQWPHNLLLNSDQMVKPEPIRSSEATAKPVNPIMQLLLNTMSKPTDVNTSSTSSNNNNSDLMSMDLKRKLNIQPTSSTQLIVSSPIVNGNSTQMLKGPISVADFEENLLNQSVTTTKPAMFYLPSTPATDSTTSSELKATNTKLTALLRRTLSSDSTADDDSSNSSDTSTSSSSSHAESDLESSVASPKAAQSLTTAAVSNEVPLLLTPAAFETSSISSTASSTYNMATNAAKSNKMFFANAGALTTDEDVVGSSNLLLENFLLGNKKSVESQEKENASGNFAAALLNKNQLQKALIHLLNVRFFSFYRLV
jgi:hypothetical protein